jgi:hypothetical protein
MRPKYVVALVIGAALLATPAMAGDFGVSFHYGRGYHGGYHGGYYAPPVVYRDYCGPRYSSYSYAPVYRSHYRPYYSHYRSYPRYYSRPHYYRSSYRYCR